MQQNETENSVIMNRFNSLLEDEPEILKYFSLMLNEDTRRKSRDQNDFAIEQPINLPIYEQERLVPKIIKTKSGVIFWVTRRMWLHWFFSHDGFSTGVITY